MAPYEFQPDELQPSTQLINTWNWDAAFLETTIKPALLIFDGVFLAAIVIVAISTTIQIRKHGLRRFANPLEDEHFVAIAHLTCFLAVSTGIVGLFAEFDTLLIMSIAVVAIVAGVYLQLSFTGWVSSHWSLLGRDPESHASFFIMLSSLVLSFLLATLYMHESARMISISGAVMLLLTEAQVSYSIVFRRRQKVHKTV
jgi:hypothetical protein